MRRLKAKNPVSQLVDMYGKPMEAPTATHNQRTGGAPISPLIYRNTKLNIGYEAPATYTALGVTNSYNLWASDYIRALLASNARLMENNDGNCRSIADRIPRYVIGDGMKPQSHSDENSDEYEMYFNEWAMGQVSPGFHDFYSLQALICKRMIVDGDMGLVFTNGGNGIKLSPVESLQLGGFHQERGIVGGIQLDDNWDPVAYYINLRNPTPSPYTSYNNVYSNFIDLNNATRVPAKDFLLLFMPRYARQMRGVSGFAAALLDANDADDLVDSEKLAVKIQSTVATILKTADPTDTADYIEGDEHESSLYVSPADYTSIFPGQMLTLQDGESFETFKTDRPAPQLKDFLELIYRRICSSLGIAYELIVDPGKTNGTSIRTIAADMEFTFAEYQRLLVRRLCQPVWNRVISRGIGLGHIPADPKAYDVEWGLSNAKISIDKGHDVKADSEALRTGIVTLKEVARRRGLDWKELLQQRAKELSVKMDLANELASKYNIPLQTVMEYLGNLEASSVEFGDDEADGT